MKHTIHHILSGLIVLIALTACKARKVPPQELPEKTAFYTIEATRDTVKQVTTFKLIKVMVVDTKINYHADEAKAKSRDFLKIEILTKQSAPVIAYSEHPLLKKFDLYEQTGEISSKLISLPKGQVTVRVPYREAHTVIRITETVNFKTAKPHTVQHEK